MEISSNKVPSSSLGWFWAVTLGTTAVLAVLFVVLVVLIRIGVLY